MKPNLNGIRLDDLLKEYFKEDILTNKENVQKYKNELEEFYRKATINEVLSSPDMTDNQKSNYLGIMFGIDNARDAVRKYESNVNLTENERKEKNEVALPYIKSNEEKRKDLIEVDQEDIDELYDEDPDDDLDI